MNVYFYATMTNGVKTVIHLDFTNTDFTVTQDENNVTIITYKGEDTQGVMKVFTDSMVRTDDYED